MRAPFQENWLFLISDAAAFRGLAVMIAVWRTAYGQRALVSGLPLPQVLTYVVAQSLFGSILSPSTQMLYELHSGGIANRYLRPVRMFGQFAAEAGGRMIPDAITHRLPILLIALAMHVDVRPRGNV